MKDKRIKKIKNIQPVLKEIKIDCRVMDNEGPRSYLKTTKKNK